MFTIAGSQFLTNSTSVDDRGIRVYSMPMTVGDNFHITVTAVVQDGYTDICAPFQVGRFV